VSVIPEDACTAEKEIAVQGIDISAVDPAPLSLKAGAQVDGVGLKAIGKALVVTIEDITQAASARTDTHIDLTVPSSNPAAYGTGTRRSRSSSTVMPRHARCRSADLVPVIQADTAAPDAQRRAASDDSLAGYGWEA